MNENYFSILVLVTLRASLNVALLFRIQWVQTKPNGVYQYFIKVSVLRIPFLLFDILFLSLALVKAE